MAYLPPSPAGDPGYIESLKTRTRLAAIRKLGLVIGVVPVVAFVVVPLLVHEGRTPAWTLLLPVLVAAGAFFACRQVARNIPALPPETEPGVAGVQALQALRQTMLVQLAVTGAPVAVGLLASLVGGSLLPYAVGFLCGWPQMVRALPDQRVIEDIRARLEARGTDSRLWAVLAQPADAAAQHRRA